jgi:hypothetical protein
MNKEIHVYHHQTEIKAGDIMTACLVALIIGIGTGWMCRTATVNDRLQRAAAEAYQANRDYYTKQADAILNPPAAVKKEAIDGN